MTGRPAGYRVVPAGLVAILIGFWLGGSAAIAANITPLPTRDQSPLAQLFGLPAAADGELVPAGKIEAAMRYDLANDSTARVRDAESLLFDGETSRATLALRAGFGSRFEVGIEIPYLARRNGTLDGFIDDWHDFFRLPEGNRDERPRNDLHYRYTRNGQTLLDFDRETSGLGDIALTAAWRLGSPERTGPSRALALRGAVKLPTGDSDELLGSGGTDVALGIAGKLGFPGRHGALALYGGLGGLFMSKADVLADQQRNLAGYGHIGGGWQPLSRLTLLLQLDGHTPLFDDTDLPQLGDFALQLTLGGTLHLPAGYHLDLGVSEDVAVSTTPDVAFLAALRRQF